MVNFFNFLIFFVSRFDSGIFAMLLMYNWNGSVIKIFDHVSTHSLNYF